tara:strand:+ start:951 stop:2429 length:1479 start_codon:yes stop_codon:yes gene_type:complete
MALIPLKIPAGMFRNGTEFEASGRWRDGNLVRWLGASLRPVGGWRDRITNAIAETARAMHTWKDSNNSQWVSMGTYNKLYVASAAGTVYDITPAGFTSGDQNAAIKTGYGYSTYGTSFYGTERPDTGNYSEATTWSLDNFGNYLVGCSVSDGKAYQWTGNVASAATAIANAPVGNLGLIVTEERFLFLLGGGGEPRTVQWSDQENITTWTPASTNQAGSQILQTSGQIMAAARGRGQMLIFTDIDMHRMTYVGAPFVYSTEKVSEACGLASRKAVTTTDAGTFWMGHKSFFVYNGSNVQELPCEVKDYVFGDINTSQISKSWSAALGQQGEIWWFYCSSASNEIDRYVSYDYKQGHWMTGDLSRTCGADRGVFRHPLMMSAGGSMYEHEVGLNYEGATVFAETGPFSIGPGDNMVKVTKLIPDELTQGDVSATFKTRLYPNGAETSHGPYAMANPTSVRFTGRQARMRVEGARLADWRVGVMRVDAVSGGRR